MSGEKRKSEAGPSSSSGGNNAGSSKRAKAVIQDLKRLECPVCLEFPRAEVYQCSNGHSVCSLCVEKLTTCPSCQAPYQTGSGGGKVRCHFAEDILDTVLFDCTWREQGCDREGLSRQQLSEHEGECEHNPNWIKLCQILFPNRRCAHKVARTFLKNPIQKMPGNFRDHLLRAHKRELKKCYGGVGYSRKLYDISKNERDLFFSRSRPLQLKERKRSPDSLGYFMIFCYKDTSVADPKLSWFMVRITDKPQLFSVAVKFTLRSCSPPNNAGDEDIPKNETCWNGRIMGLQEFHAFQGKAIGERDKFKFSLPLSHLQEYYLNAEGGSKMRYEFTVTPINNGS